MFSISQLTADKRSFTPKGFSCSGRVVFASGSQLCVTLPYASIGDVCMIQCENGNSSMAEVISFDKNGIMLAPFGELRGISPGAEVTNTCTPLRIPFGEHLLGQVVDATGRPLRQSAQQASTNCYLPVNQEPPMALDRLPISTPLQTGIRSIDTLCTLGIGQRIGLMASAGVGKSTLLGMIARNAEVDVNVIALVGERGREVREFIDECLGPAGLAKSIVVVSTSDETPLRRSLAVQTATSIAEHYRAKGKRVLLLVDSLTRTARALRDVALAGGELPIRQGFPASVFSYLPRLIERAGNDAHGSITAVYTVLTNGEGENDPLCEEIKSLLDGHIVLNSAVAAQGIRPAIDITSSISRLFTKLHSLSYQKHAEQIKAALSRLKREKDLLLFGGTPDEELAKILQAESSLKKFLNQDTHDRMGWDESISELQKISASLSTLTTNV